MVQRAIKTLKTYLPYKHDPNNIRGILKCFFAFCTKFSCKNSKIRFLWHGDNGKLDCILEL